MTVAMAENIEGMRIRWFQGDPADREFMKRGACLGSNPGVFHPDEEERRFTARVEEAKAICDMCPVKQECFEYAIKYKERQGVWGGTSERDRRKIFRAQSRRRRSQAG
jgi:WhiB family redox-sensing transcriptional regulator